MHTSILTQRAQRPQRAQRKTIHRFHRFLISKISACTVERGLKVSGFKSLKVINPNFKKRGCTLDSGIGWRISGFGMKSARAHSAIEVSEFQGFRVSESSMREMRVHTGSRLCTHVLVTVGEHSCRDHEIVAAQAAKEDRGRNASLTTGRACTRDYSRLRTHDSRRRRVFSCQRCFFSTYREMTVCKKTRGEK